MSEFAKVKYSNRLGKRLASIESMVRYDHQSAYDHIWDCCCDHGLLGFKLLENKKALNLHFVDIVPNLLNEIEQKLLRYYQGEANWHVHCLDVALLPLAQYKNEKHLIIIAGVGGLLLIDLLTRLLPLSVGLNVEFIVSPVHHNYHLREFLIDQDCVLIEEAIVSENKRFYELLHIKKSSANNNIATHGNHAISLVGNKMWNFANQTHQVYLQQIISHYQRIAKNPKTDVGHIIKAYQDLLSSV